MPIGFAPATFMATLLVFNDHDIWIRKIKRKVLNLARKYSNIFWFISDKAAINDGGEFESYVMKLIFFC